MRQITLASLALAVLLPSTVLTQADDLGRCQDERGATAIDACTQAIQSKRYQGISLSSLFFNRGARHHLLGNLEHALADYNEAIRIDPEYGKAFNNRCWLRATIGQDLTGALADCDRAHLLRPDDYEPLDSRGFVYFRLNRFDDAIKDLDAALKINPSTAESLFVRGLAKLRKGDTRGGDVDIAAAERIDSKIAEQYAKWGLRR